MSDPKNKWTQPAAPPAPMFFGENERNLVKQVNDELAERVLGQTIAYYPISIEESNFNDTYGEAVEKVSLPPVRVFAYVEVDNEQTNEKYGYEYQSKLKVNFHRRRLIEDQNLYVRVGDFVQYGDTFYEIVKLFNDTRYYFGQVEHKFQVSAECVRARDGAFRVMPGIDRPTIEAEETDVSQPAPRTAPYPPSTATYITVNPESRLPNERVLTAGTGISITDGGPNNAITISATNGPDTSFPSRGPTGSIQFLTGGGTFSGSSNLVFLTGSGRLGIGTDAPTHSLTIIGGMSASSDVLLGGDLTVKGTLFGGSPLKVAGSINIVDPNDGTVLSVLGSSSLGSDTMMAIKSFTTELTASLVCITSASLGVGATTASYLALDANNNVILTSSIGGGNMQIGISEDGTYTDGLFTDFVPTTTIGTAVDRFNEVLRILAPEPAPNLRSLNSLISDGITAKLSFGSSYPVSGYASSDTTAGFDAVGRSGSYSAAVSGSNIRLGIYEEGQDVSGTLNDNVAEKRTNGYLTYATGAFGSADTGTLQLIVNGNIIHSASMATLVGSGLPNTGSTSSLTSGSGFIDVSIATGSIDGNGGYWDIFKYRTGKYLISTGSMVPGWNYARVVHDIGGTQYTTNYIEWIRDPSGSVDDLAIANPRIEDITLIGSKFLSGVEYNTNATANYKFDIQNLYRNVYAASGTPISFTVSNSSTPTAQSVPDIAVGEDNTKTLGVTGSLNVNASVNNLFNASVTANATVSHPLKATITNAGSATTGDGFLIDNRTLASSNLVENFHDESFRKTSGSYASQATVVAGDSIWNSENHMTGGGASGHENGLLFFNQRLYSPIDSDVPALGAFSSISNVEPNQPDYSGVSGTRTFYRVVTNSSGVTKRDMRITSTKVGTTYNNSSLSTANLNVFAKIPGSTGWMDISQDFTYGSTNDGDGALIAGASNDVDSGDNVHHITFGTQSVGANEYVMLRFDADASWAGYLSQLQFQLGATTNTTVEAPIIDDIDANETGVNDAKLSFGSSNDIPSYSDATGSSIGLVDYDSNDRYTVNGDKRGVFGSKAVFGGELNEDVPSNGTNYPANAFKDAFTGSLILEVNGTEVHNIDLGSTLNAITADYNGNSSGFTVSAVGFSTTTDSIPNYIQPYRTGTYQVGPNDQLLGWNYARVLHRIGGADTTTNYVEWVVDTDPNALSSSALGLSNFDHNDVYYQSGVRYFASRPSGSYTYVASNVYRNVYQYGNAVSFPTTDNCSISNIRIAGIGVVTGDTAASTVVLPDLNNTADCETQDIQVTGTVLFDSLTSISGGFGLFTAYDVGVTSRVIHPLKSTLNTNELNKTDFMVYSGALGSTNINTEEYFNTETYRIASGNYVGQSDITDSANAWNSQYSVNDTVTYADHSDGMVTVNGYLISPKKIGNAGDTRNVADGGSLQAPAGSPNYSSLTNATRTFYRYYENNTVNDRASITLTLHGSGSLVKKATSLGANGNFYLEAKIPGKTAWLDVGTAFSTNDPLTNGAGALDGSQPGNPAISISSGGTSVVCNLNGQTLNGTISGEEMIVLKVSTNEDWEGYLSRVSISYS